MSEIGIMINEARAYSYRISSPVGLKITPNYVIPRKKCFHSSRSNNGPPSSSFSFHRRRRWGKGRGHVPPPPKKKNNREKYFSGNYHVKCWHFSGIYHVKFGNFVNFHTYFSGKNAVPPKVHWAPTPMFPLENRVYSRRLRHRRIAAVEWRSQNVLTGCVELLLFITLTR